MVLGCWIKGNVDEVALFNVEKSAHWIRAIYMEATG